MCAGGSVAGRERGLLSWGVRGGSWYPSCSALARRPWVTVGFAGRCFGLCWELLGGLALRVYDCANPGAW